MTTPLTVNDKKKMKKVITEEMLTEMEPSYPKIWIPTSPNLCCNNGLYWTFKDILGYGEVKNIECFNTGVWESIITLEKWNNTPYAKAMRLRILNGDKVCEKYYTTDEYFECCLPKNEYEDALCGQCDDSKELINKLKNEYPSTFESASLNKLFQELFFKQQHKLFWFSDYVLHKISPRLDDVSVKITGLLNEMDCIDSDVDKLYSKTKNIVKDYDKLSKKHEHLNKKHEKLEKKYDELMEITMELKNQVKELKRVVKK